MNDLPPRLDATDRAIVAELLQDGRLPNAALAKRIGVAESTCINRTRALREAGIITGFHADVDLAKIGLPIQAIIHVELRHNHRRDVVSFQTHIAQLPELVTAFYVAGTDDYLLHVAVDGPATLKHLVADRVAAHPAVSRTETQFVFEVIPGQPLSSALGDHRDRATRVP